MDKEGMFYKPSGTTFTHREEWRSCGVVIYGRILLDPTTITKNPFHFHFVWSQKIRSVITKTPGVVQGVELEFSGLDIKFKDDGEM